MFLKIEQEFNQSQAQFNSFQISHHWEELPCQLTYELALWKH